MTKLALIAAFIVPITACATTRPGPDGILASRPSGIELDLRSSTGGRSEFPARVSVADLPSANQLRRMLIWEGHSSLTARFRLCVAPDGSVAGVSLARSSGVERFDAAAAHDLAGWQYAEYAAPVGARVCQPVTLIYRP